jgi:hypothetical protein
MITLLVSVTAGGVLISLVVGAGGLLALRLATPNPLDGPRLLIERADAPRHLHPSPFGPSAESQPSFSAGGQG